MKTMLEAAKAAKTEITRLTPEQKNAALYAVAMLALSNEELAAKLDAFRQKQTEAVLKVEI